RPDMSCTRKTAQRTRKIASGRRSRSPRRFTKSLPSSGRLARAGAAANAALLEVLKGPLLAALVDEDPDHQANEREGRYEISCSDIGGVGHDAAPSALRAESLRMVVTRRRQISVRMAMM